ncbi:MAG: ribosome maturation factor RimM [Deltaproteobacteria bacterium]|nr:ribosome maturation factor RimM [Deltaproteobacteria bacterium]
MGKIVGAHGLKGALKIGAAAAPEVFLAVAEVDINGDRYAVIAAEPRKNQLLLRLEGIATRDQVEQLVGREIRGESSRFPPLPEGEYYWFQLEGLPVRHAESGELLGKLTEIISTPAHDVYVVHKGERELLLPAVEEVIIEINLDEGVIKALPPEGLLEIYAD